MLTLLLTYIMYTTNPSPIALAISIALGITLDMISYFYFKRKFYKLKIDNKKLNRKIASLEKQLNAQYGVFTNQIKLETMGTMLGNITHLWRQPLSVITSAGGNIRLNQSLGTLEEEELYKSLDAINNNAQKLSHTLDEFRLFFEPEPSKTIFYLEEPCHHVCDLLQLNLNLSYITLALEIDKINIVGYKDVYMQIFMHLLQEQCKRLESSKAFDKVILVKIYKKGLYNYIHIKNSEGKVSQKVIDSLFINSVYHRRLQATQKLVKENIRGELTAKKCLFKYERNFYEGLEFVIRASI